VNTKKRMLQAGTTLAVVACLMAGGSVAANATTDYPPEGGTWKYGNREYSSTVYAYSEYLHTTKIHKASVESSSGNWGYSGWVSRGTWAKAPEQATGWWGAHYWYDVY
jgi:hypothetical protein